MSRAVGLARSRNFANCSARSIPLRRGFQWTQPCSARLLPGSIPPRRGLLGLAGPLRRAVGEFLPFPYGQAELDPLDDGLEDAQRLFPVGG